MFAFVPSSVAEDRCWPQGEEAGNAALVCWSGADRTHVAGATPARRRLSVARPRSRFARRAVSRTCGTPHTLTSQRCANFFQRNFLKPFKLIGPSSSRLGKKSLLFFEILWFAVAIPPLQQGRIAIVTDVGRDAVDATERETSACGCGRRSRVVLAPRCRRQVCDDANALRGWRGQQSLVPGKSAEQAVKPLRGECRMFPVPPLWILMRILNYPQRAWGCGCIGHPAFPAPSSMKGDEIPGKARAQGAARSRRRMPVMAGAPTRGK